MPEALSRFVATSTHGRYLVEAPAAPGPHPVLVGFHGYGENAERHLDQLRRLPGASEWTLVSVQSLHLFYTKSGDVVGSWMTRLGREHAILDNVRYVSAVVDAVTREAGGDAPLVYAGFSQGASMAYRAAARSGHPCRGLLVLGGDMPPDVADDPEARLPPVLVGRGTRDDWFTADKLRTDIERMAGKGVAAESLEFDGGHEWHDAFLAAGGEFLSRVVAAG